MTQVIMFCGMQAAGKSSTAQKLLKENYTFLNRDTEGGTIVSLLPKFEKLLQNNQKIVLDNTFPTLESRKPFIELAQKYQVPIECYYFNTSLEDCMYNAIERMIKIYGKILTPEEIKTQNHPNIFPVAVLYKYRKEFIMPTVTEGFTSIKKIDFQRQYNVSFTNKALIVDYDSTIRECVNGNGKYPTHKDHIFIKDKVFDILKSYQDQGYYLLGISNQSGVYKKELSYDQCVELFDHTNHKIGLDIDYAFCPHQSAPLSCYCRKPNVGHALHFVHKYKLDPRQCIFVGDMTTDATFAKRAGFQYYDQKDFFI